MNALSAIKLYSLKWLRIYVSLTSMKKTIKILPLQFCGTVWNSHCEISQKFTGSINLLFFISYPLAGNSAMLFEKKKKSESFDIIG